MSEPSSKNIYRTPGKVTAEQRGHRLGQSGCVIWLTGLSASNTRQGLCSGPSKNIRRVREVVTLFADAGIICIAAFISLPILEQLKRIPGA